eukprot:3803769-Alexandrium_andersonii.AAC.1
MTISGVARWSPDRLVAATFLASWGFAGPSEPSPAPANGWSHRLSWDTCVGMALLLLQSSACVGRAAG